MGPPVAGQARHRRLPQRTKVSRVPGDDERILLGRRLEGARREVRHPRLRHARRRRAGGREAQEETAPQASTASEFPHLLSKRRARRSYSADVGKRAGSGGRRPTLHRHSTACDREQPETKPADASASALPPRLPFATTARDLDPYFASESASAPRVYWSSRGPPRSVLVHRQRQRGLAIATGHCRGEEAVDYDTNVHDDGGATTCWRAAQRPTGDRGARTLGGCCVLPIMDERGRSSVRAGDRERVPRWLPDALCSGRWQVHSWGWRGTCGLFPRSRRGDG